MRLGSMLATARRVMNAPVWGIARAPRVRGQRERGFIYIAALIAVGVMVAASLVILEQGATIARRNREAEMIWRGNQYKRAIRLYYHKTGKYPQTMDDLVKGLPQLHFLRQAYKDPTNTADGSWRFIYVNAAGSIIGSTKYATLQQMQYLDMNGGVFPAIPGAPGVSASSLATGPQPGDINSGSSSGSSFSGFSSGGNSTNSGTQNGGNGSNGNSGSTNGGQNGSTDPNSGQNPAGGSSSVLGGDNSNPQNPSQNPAPTAVPNLQNPSGPGGSGMFGPALGGSSTGNGLPSIGPTGANIPGGAANLAALAQLKPTGPVDGPVLGGFLTGVGGKIDSKSVKRYHGAKKLNEFEFIWNPLEDAAAALQNQMSNTQGGNILGQGANGANGSMNGSSSSFGGSSGIGGSSTFGNSPTQPQPAPQQNPPQ